MRSKPKVEIFSPVGVSGCSFSVWINKVWNILQDYSDNLEIISLTSDSPRAKELGVDDKSIVVNEQVTPVWELKHKKLLSFSVLLPRILIYRIKKQGGELFSQKITSLRFPFGQPTYYAP